MPMHIAKYLARSGLGSRKACEAMVEAGRVTVNGALCERGVSVSVGVDEVRVDGDRVQPVRGEMYLIHKAPGVETIDAVNECAGRHEKSGGKLLPALPLDANAEGVILAVSDAALADALTGAHCHAGRVFILSIRGQVSTQTISRLIQGVPRGDGGYVRIRARIIHEGLYSTLLRAHVDECNRKYMRHAFAYFGHTLLEQNCVAVGPIEIGGLKRGASRALTADERAWVEAQIEALAASG